MVDRRLRTTKVLDGKAHAAFELVVVIAVEQVVLPVVLILDHGLDRAQPLLEKVALGLAFLAGAIGIGAPGEIGVGEIGLTVPALLVDQRLQPGAIGSGLGTEDAVGGAARGFLRFNA
ncbi:hypothetical protein D3C87_1781540 [compost metagenome]